MKIKSGGGLYQRQQIRLFCLMPWSNDRLYDRKAPLTIKRLNSFLFNLALESIDSIVIRIEH